MIEIFNLENAFLLILAFIWVLFASIQDLRKREVANWLNFSLVLIALAYRAFYSIIAWDYRFFVYGLLGFGIFFIIANLFYYGRIFAGGDTKLLMALGAVLPMASSFYDNLIIFGSFIFLLLLLGGLYGLVYSLFLVLSRKKEFVKEFRKEFALRKKIFIWALVMSILFFILVLFIGEYFLIIICLIVLAFPFMFIYAKSAENVCMIKEVGIKELTEGDWLCENLLVKGKKIKANWEGLSSEELEFLRKDYKKKVLIKQGIPFVPSFLLAFIALLLLLKGDGLNLVMQYLGW